MSITPIENTSYYSLFLVFVIVKFMEVLWHPSSVYKKATWLFVLIKVSIEWSYYFITFLSILFFFNFYFFCVIHVSSELNWSPSPFFLGFIYVLSCERIITTVFRSDINRSFR